MRGLDALAAVCEPVTPPEPKTPEAATLTDKQIEQIAEKVISRLQTAQSTPPADESPEEPEPVIEDNPENGEGGSENDE